MPLATPIANAQIRVRRPRAPNSRQPRLVKMPRKGMNWAQGIWVKFEGLKAAVGTAEMLPDTAAAMAQLEAALTAEVPRKSGRYGSNRSKKARLGPTQRRQMHLMTQRVRRAVQGKKKAITDLRNHVKSKFGGVVTLECLVNVCVAAL